MLSDRCLGCLPCLFGCDLVYCGHEWWVKMKLGMEVGLSPGDIVLDGEPAPPPRKIGAQQPHFLTRVY